MKNRVREDISAHLDGEAKDPASIARLIAESADASKEHVAYAELSKRLRALEAPEIHPAFAARVVASIQEQGERRRIGWRVPAGFAVAAAALIVGMLSFNSGPTKVAAPAGPVITSNPVVAPVPAVSESEEDMMAELERRISQDSDVQQFVLARFENTPQPEELYTDRLIAAVAGSNGAAAAGEALAHGIDYRAAVQRLDDAQADALKQLLTASVREALNG